MILVACAKPPEHPHADDLSAFNASLVEATRRMDNAAMLALWDDDGVSLLPSTAPLVGKPAIAAMFAGVTAQLVGAHMTSFEMTCAGAAFFGAYATEYCDEHQVVELGGGKPPFDGTGRLLLVLHRTDSWRIAREMWQPR